MKIICLLLILSISTPAFAVGTYEDTTYSQWEIANPFESSTNLRMPFAKNGSLRHLWCGGTDAGSTTDALGRKIPFPGNCFPMGAYRVTWPYRPPIIPGVRR